MNLNDLQNISENFNNTQRMPVFLGHGSPMNAIEENQFVQGFRKAATEIPKPNAIFVFLHTGLHRERK
jgi:4,5-DOPA dioxygenase extradiol